MLTPILPRVSKSALKSNPRTAVKTILKEGKDWFKQSLDLKCDALKICEGRAQLIDNIIVALFEIAEKKIRTQQPKNKNRLTVLALGGYGRKEMGLCSDVDLLFLYEGITDKYIREIAEAIYYPLWDNNVEVNSTIRTLKECIKVGQSDVRTLTSLLDARFLAGDAAGARRFFNHIKDQFISKKYLRQFIQDKLTEQENRLKRYGDSISLIEPNVKDSRGGLRDYHTFLWIAKAAHPSYKWDTLLKKFHLSEEGKKELTQGVNFLWQIRHHLHFLENEKCDRLGNVQQIPIAETFGFKKGETLGPTEQLMQEYYRHASTVRLQSQRAIERILETQFPKPWIVRLFKRRRLAKGIYRIDNKILAARRVLQKDPSSILKVFTFAHQNKLSLTARTKENIMRLKHLSTEAQFNEKTKSLFKKMFSQPEFLQNILQDMFECRCLMHYFPEMKPIVHRIQHDGFHFYTIEEHSLRAINEIASLTSDQGKKTFPTLAEALKKVKRPHVLALAVLLHDVGKGHGKNHAEVGSEIGRDIARRLGYDEKDQDAVAFLIRSHLILPTLAYRRDIKDPHLITRLAETIRDPELLLMLYLLAFADVRSIGPGVWSDWKGGLLTELYQNTLAQMQEKGKEGQRRKLISKKLDKVSRILDGSITHESLTSFFASMPDRYLYAASPKTIVSHLNMTSKLAGTSVLLQVMPLPERGCTELSIVSRDQPGLFAKIAGVLSLNGINIIDAQLYTLPDKTVLDLLWVTDLLHKPIDKPEDWRPIQVELNEAITEKIDIHKIMGRNSKRRLLSKDIMKHEPLIEIDNDVSAGETVVDVIAQDRPGLLYGISRTFFELGCSIDRAKITTHIDKVIDVFYIRDATGEKITSRERLKHIEEAIARAIS